MASIPARRRVSSPGNFQLDQLPPVNHLAWPSLIALAALLAFLPLTWLLIAGTGIMAVIVLLRCPWLIWAIIGAVLPWTSGLRMGTISITDILVVCAVVLWFADAVRRRYVRLRLSAPAIAALSYTAALFLTSFMAVDVQAALIQIIKWLQFAIILLILPPMLVPENVPWVVSGLFIGAVGQAFLGLYQFYFQVGPEWFMLPGGFMRASGSFGQPNPYGGYLGLTLPVTLSVFIWFSLRPVRKQRLTVRDIIAWIVIRGLGVVITAGVVVSWSRGAWFGAVASTLWIIWLSSSRIMRIMAILLLVGILLFGAAAPLATLAPAGVVERFAELPAQFDMNLSINMPVTDENFAVLERLAHWLAALRMWNASPWLGIGPGNYAARYAEFNVARWEDPLGHAHNIYLNVLAETGLIGFTAFLALWITIFVYAYRSYLHARYSHRWQAALSLGVLGVITHLAVHSLFDNLFVQGIFLHLSLWIAILLSLQPVSRQ